MTIREFWHDIRDRFLEDDHHRDERWRSGERDYRGGQRQQWHSGDYRDNDRDSYARDYDRSGMDRHYGGRGMMPMGVHGLDAYRDEESQWRARARRPQEQRSFSAHDRDHEQRLDRPMQRDEWQTEPSGASWPDRYHSRSAGVDYRGRGPSNWQRSDTRLYEEVCECLMEDDEIDASEIEVKVEGGIVTLTGTVEERNDKRRAEDVIERIPGVRDVHNNLQVQRARDTFLGTRDALRDTRLGH